MPELPDVQVFKEYVDATSLHQRIVGVHSDASDLRQTVDEATLKRRVEGRELSESRLMNQEVLAGLGNECTDEILFQVRLHPKTRIDTLDDEALERLYNTMREVIEKAVEARADPDRMPESFPLSHREEGAPCPRCGRPLEKIEVVGRPTYLCPREQKRLEA